MQKIKFRNWASQGFTLIEFIVYTTLLAIVVIFLFRVLIGGLDSQGRGKAKEAVITDAISAINAIDFEIRHAYDIYDSTSDFASNPGQLSLLTRQEFVTGEREAYLDIFLNSEGSLCIKREKTGVKCITSDRTIITSLDFDEVVLTDDTENGVKTTITVEYDTTIEDNKVPFTIESFSQLRN
ncbi:MAG: hypothetical protein R3251_01430 [Candidatus Spechtbacterales bacterium]|nr:hypothetical protein [Candidatus Spechtbacterales bacterium]